MPRGSKIYFHKTFLSLSKCFLYANGSSHFVLAIAARKRLYVFPYAVKLFGQKVDASCCVMGSFFCFTIMAVLVMRACVCVCEDKQCVSLCLHTC